MLYLGSLAAMRALFSLGLVVASANETMDCPHPATQRAQCATFAL